MNDQDKREDKKQTGIKKASGYSLHRYHSPWRIGLRSILQTILLVPFVRLNFRMHVQGRGQIAKLATNQNVIIVANHNSHLDTPSIVWALPRRRGARTAIGAASDYFFKGYWRSKPARLLLNTFPIGRRGEKRYQGITEKLALSGVSILLFPEGTRSRTGKMADFHSGAFRIAIEHGIPVLPIALSGTATAWPAGRRLWRWGRPHVHVKFLPMIYPQANDTAASLASKCQRAIAQQIDQKKG